MTQGEHMITPRTQLERDTAHALANLDYGPPLTESDALDRAHNYQWLLDCLHPYSDESLTRFAATALTSSGADLRDLLVKQKSSETHLNDWITIDSIAREDGDAPDPITAGLDYYESLTPYSSGAYPDRRREEILAITNVTIHLISSQHGISYGIPKHYHGIAFIEDAKLRDLITTHKNPNAVADLIIERDITDTEQITALLETMSATTNAIRDGVL
jgi:hypothetical protein